MLPHGTNTRSPSPWHKPSRLISRVTIALCRTAVSALRMQVEEPTEAAPAPAVAEEAPVAEKKEEKGFDWTQCARADRAFARRLCSHWHLVPRLRRYSLTIAIFTAFVTVKTLSALGIYNPSGR